MVKKQKGRKMAYGGYTGDAGTNRGSWSGDGRSLGVTTGTTTGTSATNRPSASAGTRSQNPMKNPPPIKRPSPAEQPVNQLTTVNELEPGYSWGNYANGATLGGFNKPGKNYSKGGKVSRSVGGVAKRGIGRALGRGGKKK